VADVAESLLSRVANRVHRSSVILLAFFRESQRLLIN
jgi:hypothetical protein